MSTLSQFAGGRIKSIQRGTISSGAGGTNTVTINAVDVNKSLLSHLGTNLYTRQGRLSLSSSTEITIIGDANATISWEVVEFY
jgi:hypothetical protein